MIRGAIGCKIRYKNIYLTLSCMSSLCRCFTVLGGALCFSSRPSETAAAQMMGRGQSV